MAERRGPEPQAFRLSRFSKPDPAPAELTFQIWRAGAECRRYYGTPAPGFSSPVALSPVGHWSRVPAHNFGSPWEFCHPNLLYVKQTFFF